MSAVPVGAVTVAEATIDVHSEFAQPVGTFTADSDLLCDSGTTTDETLVAGKWPGDHLPQPQDLRMCRWIRHVHAPHPG